jgi:hypothetical protein
MFRLLPLAVACPAVMAPFSITIDTDIPVNSNAVIQFVNLRFWDKPDDDVTEPVAIRRRGINVETVNITGLEGAYQVQVVGTVSGDCGSPLQEEVGLSGAATVIEIFDYLTENAICTRNIIPYDNTFTVSQMPVVVNGQTYFADESGTNLPEEGNTMRVDNVIENVEVAVMESFPMQLHLTVTGPPPHGCRFPVQVEPTVTETPVQIHIFREIPADTMCPAMIMSYEDTIIVDGSFTGGTVTITVNNQTVSVEL